MRKIRSKSRCSSRDQKIFLRFFLKKKRVQKYFFFGKFFVKKLQIQKRISSTIFFIFLPLMIINLSFPISQYSRPVIFTGKIKSKILLKNGAKNLLDSNLF